MGAERVAIVDIFDMVDSVKESGGSQRRLRLFACSCCRRVWELLYLNEAKRAVEIAEVYADELTADEDLLSVHQHPDFNNLAAQLRGQVQPEVQMSLRTLMAVQSAHCLTRLDFNRFGGAAIVARDTSLDPARDFFPSTEMLGLGVGLPEEAFEIEVKANLLRDIFGNPFRPVIFDLSWRTETTVALAQGAYQERFLPSGELDVARLMILADALEEAGCDNEEILSHLRSPGPHVRGCWALDLVLGKT